MAPWLDQAPLAWGNVGWDWLDEDGDDARAWVLHHARIEAKQAGSTHNLEDNAMLRDQQLTCCSTCQVT